MNNCLPTADSITVHSYGSNLPDYRYAISGLNFDAKCESCNKTVIIQSGHTPAVGVDLAQAFLELACPVCKTQQARIKPKNVVALWFSNCNYEVKVQSFKDGKSKKTGVAEQLEKIVVGEERTAASVHIKTWPREQPKS